MLGTNTSTRWNLYFLQIDRWYLERRIYIAVGINISVASVLILAHSAWWALFTGFVGAAMVWFAATGYCVMANMLYWLGAEPRLKSGVGAFRSLRKLRDVARMRLRSREANLTHHSLLLVPCQALDGGTAVESASTRYNVTADDRDAPRNFTSVETPKPKTSITSVVPSRLNPRRIGSRNNSKVSRIV